MVHKVWQLHGWKTFCATFIYHHSHTNKGDVGTMILLLYSDDMLIIGPDEEVIKELKEKLLKIFEMRILEQQQNFGNANCWDHIVGTL